MCGCMYVWVLKCVGVGMCGCFDNCVGVLVICVFVFNVFCTFRTVFFCIVSFIYIYSYLFCLH